PPDARGHRSGVRSAAQTSLGRPSFPPDGMTPNAKVTGRLTRKKTACRARPSVAWPVRCSGWVGRPCHLDSDDKALAPTAEPSEAQAFSVLDARRENDIDLLLSSTFAADGSRHLSSVHGSRGRHPEGHFQFIRRGADGHRVEPVLRQIETWDS